MALESRLTEEQLFDQLISSLVHSAWVAMGKIKNPMTDKLERDLQQAATSIDMLDMLYKRMTGNLSDAEEQYLTHVIRELKINYVEEQKIVKESPESSSEQEPATEQEGTKDQAEPAGEQKQQDAQSGPTAS
jgi:hypothetical protein